MVFWEQRLVVLAVPKTGTNAYAQALASRASLIVRHPPELKHLPLYRFDRFVRPLFSAVGAPALDIAAVIREPIDWLGSWYRYRKRPALDGRARSTQGLSFDAFVRAACSDQPPDCARVGSQSRFVRSRPDGPEVTHLFRYEDMERFDDFLRSRLGDFPPVARVNASMPEDLCLTRETEALAKDVRAQDFALWSSI